MINRTPGWLASNAPAWTREQIARRVRDDALLRALRENRPIPTTLPRWLSEPQMVRA